MRWTPPAAILIAAVPFVAAICGCGPNAAPLTAADRAGIEATTQAFTTAARAKDWAAVGATYTTDAVLMPPNAPSVTGREAIIKFLGTLPPLTSFSLTNVEVEGEGGIAYVRGTYQLTMAMEGQNPMEETGKFLEIRRKQPDASWLIYRDMFSSDAPPPTGASAPPTD
jgi:ketosteroid isomerase-like protein